MTETTFNSDIEPEAQTSLLHSFAIASVLVIAGVALSVMLLSSPKEGSEIGLPAVPVPAWLNEQENTQGSLSWLDLAEKAFTSGRIIEPVDDNALYYYHQAVTVNAADTKKMQYLEIISPFLVPCVDTHPTRALFVRSTLARSAVTIMPVCSYDFPPLIV